MERQEAERIVETLGISDDGRNSIVIYEDEPYRIVAFGRECIGLSHLYEDTLVSGRTLTYTEALEASEDGRFSLARIVECSGKTR